MNSSGFIQGEDYFKNQLCVPPRRERQGENEFLKTRADADPTQATVKPVEDRFDL